MDNYSPILTMMKVAQNALARYENWPIFQPFKNFIRHYANKFCIEYMAAEDLQTNYIDIGPVNKVLNMISAYDGKSPRLDYHMRPLSPAHFMVLISRRLLCQFQLPVTT
jgi:hypothetical protein